MNVHLNGAPREVPEGSTVADLLRELKLEGRPVAVERNRELVRKADHAAVRLAEGDRLEVVSFVGGG